ncbi:CLUMA_CG000739, isoform A [Clunio marinus]|uniref:CLUMA_CG000739, isoform A n=1 Tax=Clunio marinus TaxID=568069 RepID=A0A1J1HKC9_9DIPT|nr:CLUMA_CG000739, isoform A [Clunio marinus]
MPLKVLRKPELNTKVVLKDIFSDFKNSNEKCRLCFEEVFDQNSRVNVTTDKKDEINILFQVYLSLNERESEFVCSKCENEINNLHQFKRKINENHKYFEKLSSLKYDNASNENFIKTEPELSISKESTLKKVIQKTRRAKHRKIFKQLDLNVKVVLEDIFSDFKNFNEKCSLCFKEVFYQKSRIHLTDDIKDKIYSILQINFSVNGSGSEFLCSKCENEIKNFHRFKEMINEKQKYFEKCSSMKKDKAKNYELTLTFNEHLVKSEPELTIVDEVEEETSESENENQNDSIEDHLLEPNVTDQEIQTSSGFVPCNVCGKQFKGHKNRKQHYLRVHVNKRPHQCDICGKRFRHPCLVAAHMKRHRERKTKRHRERKTIKEINYKCDRCESSFFSNGDLRKHELQFHKDDIKPHQCNICGRRFLVRRRLDLHMETHRENRTKDHHCDICKTSYFHIEALHSHILRYHEDKPFSCTKCGKSFKLEQNLKIHICNFFKESCKNQHDMSNKQDLKSFPCEICGKLFRNGSQLKQHHRRVHLKIKAYQCDICDKSFYVRKDLARHIDTHRENRTRDYHCYICEKSYLNNEGLRKHVRRCHENIEKPYQCDICSKKFDARYEIAAHVDIHRKYRTRDFNCDICKTYYFNKILLQQHKSHCHGNKIFSCAFCGRTFKTKRERKSHSCSYFKKSNKNNKKWSRTNLILNQTISQNTPCEICGRIFKHVSCSSNI